MGKNIVKHPGPADNNPCFKEQDLSYKCLSKNNYIQEKCSVQFENYKACKDFWNMIRKERLKKGIEPAVPAIEERQQIFEERFKGKKFVIE